ncbi:MAG: TolB family protein [Planctomycetota bacterium]|jgi:Tol biopolymer transport system component
MKLNFSGLIALALVTIVAGAVFAGKGGGKPGGEDPGPPDPAIAYNELGSSGVRYLVVADADGSNATAIVQADQVGAMDWSPAGDQLCFYAHAPDRGLYVVNVDGSGLTLVRALEEGGSVYGTPGWCPVAAADGEFKIAFCERKKNAGGTWDYADVYLVNPDGSGLVAVTNSPTINELAVSWSPDGRRLVVGDSHNTTHRILVYSFDEGGTEITGTTALTDSGPLAGLEVNDPRWAKTKDEVVVETGMHLWVIPIADPGSPRQITSSGDDQEFRPEWSEDDTAILYVGRKKKGRNNWESPYDFRGWLLTADGSDAPGDELLPPMNIWNSYVAWRR